MGKKLIFSVLFLLGCSKDATDATLANSTPIILNQKIKEQLKEEKKEIKAAIDETIELSSYKTKYASKEKFYNRASNIELVASKINRTVIEPGNEFSFNNTVGPRTIENGYKKATVIFLGEKTEGVGGGTCQVSSTLYAASMLGRLKVTQRTSHSRPSDYIPKGFDATVSYPALDLKIQNIYTVPLIIIANASNNILNIKFVGIQKGFNVKYAFIAGKKIEYNQRVLKLKYHKGEPKLKQKGKEGLPGFMVWVYNYNDGSKQELRVPSNYKAIDEIWHVNSSYNKTILPR